MADNQVVVDIKLLSNQMNQKLKQIEKQTKKTASVFSKLGTSVVAINQGFQLAGAAIRKITGAFSAVVDAAQIQEDAVNELNTALYSAGDASRETSESFQKFASSLQQTTTFGDEATLSAAALFTQLTKVTGEGLEQATIAAQNLAAGLKVDLNTAMRLIAKSSEDSGSGLKRYNVVVKKGADGAETLANAVEAVNEQFSGVAASKVDTYSGATTQLSNAWGDLLEEIGFYITKNPAVINAVKGITKFLTGAGEAVGGFTGRLSDDELAAAKENLRELQEGIDRIQISAQGAEDVTGGFIGGFGRMEDPAVVAARAQEIIDLVNEIKLAEQIRSDEAQAVRDAAEIKRKSDQAKKLAEAKRVSIKEELKLDLSAKSTQEKWDKLSGKQKIANFKATANTIATLSTSKNKALAIIGKTAAVASTTIDGIRAVQVALRSGPFPVNIGMAAIVGGIAAANVAKVVSTPAYQDGGIVPGNSFTGDRVPALVNSGELILNQAQQDSLAGQVAGGNITINIEAGVVEDNDALIDDIVSGINKGTEFRNVQLRAA